MFLDYIKGNVPIVDIIFGEVTRPLKTVRLKSRLLN